MTEPSTILPRVYIFSGDDIVGKETAKANTLRSITASGPQPVIEHFDPVNESFLDYIQKMLMPNLFGDARVFIVNHAEALAEAEITELDRLLSEPFDDVYVTIDIGVSGKKKSAKTDPVKKLHAAQRCKKEPARFVYRSFTKPPDYKMAQWLLETVPDLCGRTIQKDAADKLVDLAGYDSVTLHSEIQKIDIHLEEGKTITAEAVEKIAGASRQMTVFELAAACGGRQGTRVLQIIDSLFTTTCSIPMIVSVLYRHYAALFRIRQYARKVPNDVKMLLGSGRGGYQAKNEAAFRIGRAAGLLRDDEERKVYPVIIASGIVSQAQHYTDNELTAIFTWLVAFDAEIKTGRLSGTRRDVELFCFKLLRVSELRQTGGTQ